MERKGHAVTHAGEPDNVDSKTKLRPVAAWRAISSTHQPPRADCRGFWPEG